MSHSVPVSATFNLFNYINLTPSIRLTDRMYTKKINRESGTPSEASRRWTPSTASTTCGISSIRLARHQNLRLLPAPRFLGKKVKMIRHVLTPSVSFSGAPDWSSPFFGYYGSYAYTDSRGQEQVRKIPKFPNALLRRTGPGKTGSVSVSLSNNLEMKIKSDADSTGEKKISLIENLNISQSYNFAADSLNWSDISTSILLRLTKELQPQPLRHLGPLHIPAQLVGHPVKVNKTRLSAGKGWGRLMRTGTSFSYTFNNDTF